MIMKPVGFTYRRFRGLLAGLLLALGTTSANATLIFSDIVLTSRSISFTVDGDLSGFTPDPGTNRRQFSILFSGDFWVGAIGAFSRNTWSTSPFDNVGILFAGNTGWFNGATTPYTWVQMNADLTGALANNRAVTVDFGDDYLDLDESGTVEFFWGNGYTTSNKTSIQVAAADPIPNPTSMALLALAMAGVGVAARRKRAPLPVYSA